LLEGYQSEVEMLGDMYNQNSLVLKLLNPWNFMDFALISDKEEIMKDYREFR
jgi:hypothetical protein